MTTTSPHTILVSHSGALSTGSGKQGPYLIGGSHMRVMAGLVYHYRIEARCKNVRGGRDGVIGSGRKRETASDRIHDGPDSECSRAEDPLIDRQPVSTFVFDDPCICRSRHVRTNSREAGYFHVPVQGLVPSGQPLHRVSSYRSALVNLLLRPLHLHRKRQNQFHIDSEPTCA